MLTKENLEQVVAAKLAGTDYCLIEIFFRENNVIVVEIDSKSSIDIDFCAELNRHIVAEFAGEIDDYELEVGSVGLTSPFKTLFQYEKNVGNEVEVLSVDGRKICGTLVEATPEYFLVETEKKIRREGEKRKVLVKETEKFTYESVKYTKYLIKF